MEQEKNAEAKLEVKTAGQKLPSYEDTMAALKQAETELPKFDSSYDAEISKLYDKIVNREDFRYDPGSDPVYAAYRERYTREGKLAMRDGMAQAADLTGGYGSSYSQTVGNQQYGAYLEKLGNVMPQLYSAAYSRYKAEGDELSSRLSLAASLGEDEYGRYRDELGDIKEQQAVAREQEQQAYERQQESFKLLMGMIASYGYQPSAEEMESSGMSQAQVDAVRTQYLRANGLLSQPTGKAVDHYSAGGAYSGEERMGKDEYKLKKALENDRKDPRERR